MLDYAVVIGYLVGCVVLGSIFARRQKDTSDFFLAGRTMSWFPVAISIVATDFSALSFLGVPAYVFKYNLMLVPGLLVLPLITPLVILLFMTLYYRLNVFTAYEYLELRFHTTVRAAASFVFILMRLFWLAAAIYATSVAISQISGISISAGILIMGLGTSIYTMMGGMKAVIWTDVAQFFVFVTGIATMFAMLLREFNWSVLKMWEIADLGGKTQLFDFSFSMSTVNLWSVLIGLAFINLTSYGVDQVILQRYLTTKNLRQAKQSLMANAVIAVAITAPLYLLGLGLYAFYRIHSISIDPDRIVPYFVVNMLPSGFSGLLVAAILAATMSSISSGINSITTATVVDFYERYIRHHDSASHYLRAARLGTLLWGFAATVLALFVGQLGTIIEISLKTNGFFAGVLLGMFLLGILTRRATWQGVAIGALLGFAIVAYASLVIGVFYLWYSPIGCVTTMVIGYTASLLWPMPPRRQVEGLVLGLKNPLGRVK